ncbi:MAG: glycosyltransferase family 2 protein [Patescibacteria group bacterium]
MQEERTQLKITVAIPCYNEKLTIAKVISDFRAELPDADIFIFDNNSSDGTAEIAKECGAKVFFEKKQGKGYVLRNMFHVINSDIFVLVDGDDTYFARDVHKLLEPIKAGRADMAVGSRLLNSKKGFSLSHRFGNAVFKYFLNYLFSVRYSDILSGYRVMTKDFYKSIPLLARGFEIETELTLQSLERDFIIKEIPIQYRERPKGSHSKISKFRDGSRIILTIISLLRDYRPMVFFGYLGGFFIIAGVLFGTIIIDEYYRTGYISRVPTAILSITLVIIGINALISGLILSAVNRRQKETEEIIKQINNVVK